MSGDGEIFVNYQHLQDGEAQILQISQRIEQKLSDLKSRLGRIAWEGTDQQAYQTYQGQWDRAIADLNTILAKTGALVGSAHGNYKQTENSNTTVWNGS
jgi:WXG100 family type VII secretion target